MQFGDLVHRPFFVQRPIHNLVTLRRCGPARVGPLLSSPGFARLSIVAMVEITDS
jgi:hypothetical protein